MTKKINKVFCLFIIVMLFYPTLTINADDHIYKINLIKDGIYKNDIRVKIEGKNMDYLKIRKENFSDICLLAQIIQAEAGNQDLTGKRYVADVVLNRVDSEIFPNTIEEVIFQDNQFSVIKDGTFDEVRYSISEESFKAVILEYETRLNYDILYFGQNKSKYASSHFKYQDHWFGY